MKTSLFSFGCGVEVKGYLAKATPRAKRSFARGVAFVFLLAAASTLPSTASAATLSKPTNNLGLVGYWSFNEGTSTIAHDFSGNNHTGTITSTASPLWTTGRFGNALNFDSTTWVDNGSTGGLRPTQWTVGMWVYTNTSTYSALLKSPDGNGYTSGYMIGVNSSPFIRYGDGTNFAGAVAGGTTIVGGWHHITGSYDGTTLRLYIDGSLSNSGTASSLGYAGTSDMWIGASNGVTTLDGRIDDVRFYDRTLSDAEIWALYTAGSARSAASNENGMVGHWTFDEGSGSIAHDFSGNGNTGTLSGTTPPSWVGGKYSEGLSFDGSTSYVTGSGIDLPNVGSSGNVTISAWVKPSTISGTQTVFNKGASAVCFNYGLVLINGKVYARNSNNDWVVSSGTVPAGTWTFVTVVFNGSGAQGYINGVLESSNASGATTNCATTNWVAGIRAYNTLSQPFSGSLDDIRVFHKALSADQVANLYKSSGVTKINDSRNSRLTDGLVGLWSFDGPDVTDKVYDRSGQGNNGYFVGGATSSAKTIGKLGQGLTFNGTSNYIDVPDATSLNVGSAMSASAWIYPTSNASYQPIVARIPSSYAEGWEMANSNGLYRVTLRGPYRNIATGSVTLNKWHLVAFTFDGSTLTLYVDGLSVGTASGSATLDSSGTDAMIGARAADLNRFSGNIDDVRIYNRALSASEVKQLYNMGK